MYAPRGPVKSSQARAPRRGRGARARAARGAASAARGCRVRVGTPVPTAEAVGFVDAGPGVPGDMTRTYVVLEREDDCGGEDASTELTELRAGMVSIGGSSRAPRPKGIGERHVIMVCFFFGGLILDAQRAGMAAGIVRMQSIFGWNKEQQGMLLSAFFLGATDRSIRCSVPMYLRTAVQSATL